MAPSNNYFSKQADGASKKLLFCYFTIGYRSAPKSLAFKNVGF
jgi:hypothetical protein